MVSDVKIVIIIITRIPSLTVLTCFINTITLNAPTKSQFEIRNLGLRNVHFLSEGHIAYKWQS